MVSEVKFFDIFTSEETTFDLFSVLEIRTECFTVDWRNMETDEIDHTEDVHICVVTLCDGRIMATAPSGNGDEIGAIADGLAAMCNLVWEQASACLN